MTVDGFEHEIMRTALPCLTRLIPSMNNSDRVSYLLQIIEIYILCFNLGRDQESGRSGDRRSGIADPGDHFFTSQTRIQPGKLDGRLRRTSIRFVEVRAYPNSSNRFASLESKSG